eukprot:NODE_1040_length_1929_cov_31.833887_g989_i0.p1 GENE.NODE_1040_length_1929_cov_31.833887_g989_i0~~NODE_1040_length_1929_cov_31.833887_g989_i0.p1  ORF type:complete len:613 (-),score=90.44 NODE_1040_length_1929_cov_31.833887_g989_i0:89-1654(-)
MVAEDEITSKYRAATGQSATVMKRQPGKGIFLKSFQKDIDYSTLISHLEEKYTNPRNGLDELGCCDPLYLDHKVHKHLSSAEIADSHLRMRSLHRTSMTDHRNDFDEFEASMFVEDGRGDIDDDDALSTNLSQLFSGTFDMASSFGPSQSVSPSLLDSTRLKSPPSPPKSPSRPKSLSRPKLQDPTQSRSPRFQALPPTSPKGSRPGGSARVSPDRAQGASTPDEFPLPPPEDRPQELREDAADKELHSHSHANGNDMVDMPGSPTTSPARIGGEDTVGVLGRQGGYLPIKMPALRSHTPPASLTSAQPAMEWRDLRGKERLASAQQYAHLPHEYAAQLDLPYGSVPTLPPQSSKNSSRATARSRTTTPTQSVRSQTPNRRLASQAASRASSPMQSQRSSTPQPLRPQSQLSYRSSTPQLTDRPMSQQSQLSSRRTAAPSPTVTLKLRTASSVIEPKKQVSSRPYPWKAGLFNNRKSRETHHVPASGDNDDMIINGSVLRQKRELPLNASRFLLEMQQGLL